MFIRAIALQEARLSSEIGNIVTKDDEMDRALADDPEQTDPATKEVLRYGHALRHGFERLGETVYDPCCGTRGLPRAGI